MGLIVCRWCRQSFGLTAPLMAGQPAATAPAQSSPVLFSFSVTSYSVLLMSEMKARRILTNISGLNGPLPLQGQDLDATPLPSKAMMCPVSYTHLTLPTTPYV